MVFMGEIGWANPDNLHTGGDDGGVKWEMADPARRAGFLGGGRLFET